MEQVLTIIAIACILISYVGKWLIRVIIERSRKKAMKDLEVSMKEMLSEYENKSFDELTDEELEKFMHKSARVREKVDIAVDRLRRTEL